MTDTTQRGVSEAIGFVLVFAIIISMVALVYASGLSGLQDARDAERIENSERAFDVLAHNIEDLSHRNAPSRATEIKLADAQIGVESPAEVNVSTELVGGPASASFSTVVSSRPIKYDAGSTSAVIYEIGAVIRQDGTASAMKRSPGFRISDSGTVVPIIDLSTTNPGKVGGSTTVLVRTDRVSSEVLFSNTTGTWNTWINVTSSRAEAWHRYLSDFESTSCTLSGDEVSCNFTTNSIYIVDYRIRVNIEE